MPTEYHDYNVTVKRTVQINAADPFEAGQRGLDLMQRQKAWPGSLSVEIARISEDAADE